MLYEQKGFVHTTYRQVVPILHGRRLYAQTTYIQIVHMLYGKNIFVNSTYGQVVYMFSGRIFDLWHLDKDLLDDMEGVFREKRDKNGH